MKKLIAICGTVLFVSSAVHGDSTTQKSWKTLCYEFLDSKEMDQFGTGEKESRKQVLKVIEFLKNWNERFYNEKALLLKKNPELEQKLEKAAQGQKVNAALAFLTQENQEQTSVFFDLLEELNKGKKKFENGNEYTKNEDGTTICGAEFCLVVHTSTYSFERKKQLPFNIELLANLIAQYQDYYTLNVTAERTDYKDKNNVSSMFKITNYSWGTGPGSFELNTWESYGLLPENLFKKIRKTCGMAIEIYRPINLTLKR